MAPRAPAPRLHFVIAISTLRTTGFETPVKNEVKGKAKVKGTPPGTRYSHIHGPPSCGTCNLFRFRPITAPGEASDDAEIPILYAPSFSAPIPVQPASSVRPSTTETKSPPARAPRSTWIRSPSSGNLPSPVHLWNVGILKPNLSSSWLMH